MKGVESVAEIRKGDETGVGSIHRYTTKKWMNLLTPIARPLFEWNHNVVMNWGAKGLEKRLRTTVVA